MGDLRIECCKDGGDRGFQQTAALGRIRTCLPTGAHLGEPAVELAGLGGTANGHGQRPGVLIDDAKAGVSSQPMSWSAAWLSPRVWPLREYALMLTVALQSMLAHTSRLPSTHWSLVLILLNIAPIALGVDGRQRPWTGNLRRLLHHEVSKSAGGGGEPFGAPVDQVPLAP